MALKIFVTGGAGYIGSHATVELLRNGYEVCVFDNFSNSSRSVLERVKLASNRSPILIEGDINSGADLNRAFKVFNADAVIHFAGLKSVSESVESPATYYETNVGGTSKLLDQMTKAGVRKIVFSSSATVYGNSTDVPYVEGLLPSPVNPYGSTKLVCEELIHHWVNSSKKNKGVCLRYFNPVGADSSGFLGEDFDQECGNLVPVIIQVLTGARHQLEIFGTDYDTIDGTGVRDYVHITDLVFAHIAAIESFDTLEDFEVFNLGTGMGTTVLQLVSTFEQVTNRSIPIKISNRRAGDVAISYADPSKAKAQLGVNFNRDITTCVEDAWKWAINHQASLTTGTEYNAKRIVEDNK